MNEMSPMEERLWNYIDGTCEPAEQSAIENLIRSNIEWNRKYKELFEANQLLQSSELEAPSLRFVKNVMEEISRHQVAAATKTYINKRIIWGIGIFFLALLTGFLVYGFSQMQWTATGGSDSTNLLTDWKMPKMEWDKFFNSAYTNIFLAINVVLGLMLLDMYLQRRKKKQESMH